MLLLLAEDDPKISKLLLKLLAKDGFQVDHAVDGSQVLMYVESNVYDLIIMDWMMPEMDGVTAARTLRSRGYQGGILMLTARDGLVDKIAGFEAGVDDYLVKPFEYQELQVRILALLRRSRQLLSEDQLIVGPIKIMRNHQQVTIKNKEIILSKREYQLLLVLAENKGQTIPRDRLIDLVWGMDAEVTPNNLDAYIRLLRKKIEHKDFKPIVNIRGIGYKLEV